MLLLLWASSRWIATLRPWGLSTFLNQRKVTFLKALPLNLQFWQRPRSVIWTFVRVPFFYENLINTSRFVVLINKDFLLISSELDIPVQIRFVSMSGTLATGNRWQQRLQSPSGSMYLEVTVDKWYIFQQFISAI